MCAHIRRRIGATRPLLAVAGIQAVTGLFVSWGCLCHDPYTQGLMLSFGMGFLVVTFAGLAFWSLKHPLAALTAAAVLEAVFTTFISHPAIRAPWPAWLLQAAVMPLIIIAMVSILRHHRLRAAARARAPYRSDG